MKTEETKSINEEMPSGNGNVNPADSIEEPGTKKFSKSSAAFAAGGFVAGAGVAASVQAFDAGKTEEIITETTEDIASINPEPQDVIMATDEGMRIAQVSDSQSFASAFADARAQVGPGGAFEWRGNVYNTYYKEEWDAMTPEQRHEYQANIDYREIAPATGHHDHTHHASNPHPVNNTIEPEPEQQNGEIKILGIEEVIGPDGQPMTVVGVEVEGDEALLIDINRDDVIEVMITDANHDGQISDDEIIDISDVDIRVSDLEQNMMESAGLHYVSHDNLPDYTNDADTNTII